MIASLHHHSLPRLLVIGAGPAGVSAAIRLRDHGIDVLLVDRSGFPRDKVCGCCLNLSAIDSLARIGCDRLLTSLSAGSLTRWEMRRGDRLVQVSLPGGIALSRYAMDAALVEVAVRRGAEVQLNCEARITDVTNRHVRVLLRRSDGSRIAAEFDAVVFASGLSGGGVSRWLPFVKSPSGPVGAGIVVNAFPQVEPGTIHMICGTDGYVGLVQLEDGRIDVAAAIHRPSPSHQRLSRLEIAARVDKLLRSAGMPSLAMGQLDQWRMTPPLSRSRQVGLGGLIAVGDAAWYSEPFTGEGMAWAIQSGIAAADCIAKHGRASDDQTLGAAWSTHYHSLIRRRRWICRALTGALRSDVLAACIVPAIGMAPWVAQLAIKHLNRPA